MITNIGILEGKHGEIFIDAKDLIILFAKRNMVRIIEEVLDASTHRNF